MEVHKAIQPAAVIALHKDWKQGESASLVPANKISLLAKSIAHVLTHYMLFV